MLPATFFQKREGYTHEVTNFFSPTITTERKAIAHLDERTARCRPPWPSDQRTPFKTSTRGETPLSLLLGLVRSNLLLDFNLSGITGVLGHHSSPLITTLALSNRVLHRPV